MCVIARSKYFLKKALKECFCSVAVGVLFEIKAYLDDMTVVGGSNSVSSEAVPWRAWKFFFGPFHPGLSSKTEIKMQKLF